MLLHAGGLPCASQRNFSRKRPSNPSSDLGPEFSILNQQSMLNTASLITKTRLKKVVLTGCFYLGNRVYVILVSPFLGFFFFHAKR